MKVDSIRVIDIKNVYTKYKTQNNETVKKVKGDSLELSKEAKAFIRLSKEEPESNIDTRIEKIRASIQDGSYKIDSKMVAKGLIDTMRGNKV